MALWVSTVVLIPLPPNAYAQEGRDAAPLKRVPPIMPKGAKHSGYCDMTFDLSFEGVPENIKSIFCTDNLFEANAVESIKKWSYSPKIANGIPVFRQGIETKISYRLSRENGDLIPETEVVEVSNWPYDGGQRQADTTYQIPPLSSRPAKGEASDFCCMMFSVSQIGTPFNVMAENCSNEKLSKSANSLIRVWRYDPVKKNGIPVSSDDYAQVVFFVKRKWSMIRDRNGYTPILGASEDYTRMCRIIS